MTTKKSSETGREAGRETGPEAGRETGRNVALPTLLLLLLPVLLFLGTFLPGPATWGINHLAYMPSAFVVAWLGVAVILLLPPVQARLRDLFSGPLPQFFVESWYGPIIAAAAATVGFAVFNERAFFMGDGYLVGELVEKGLKFRAFDNMDYRLHFEIFRSMQDPMSTEQVSSFEIYRWGAVLAGFLGTLVMGLLISHLAWEPWRKLLAYTLFLFSGTAAMFYGYVESYGYLIVWMSAFLVSGVLVMQKRWPLWGASAFLGLAAFFHLTASFAGPALLFLIARAPKHSLPRRILEGLLPAALIFGVSVAAHLSAGYDMHMFRTEFLDAKNTNNLWVPLTGERGLLSLYHWKDLVNLGLLAKPVAWALVLGGLGYIWSRKADRAIQFLLVHTASMAVFVVLIDRKLGGARDWDLFAAHGFGLVLLGALGLGAVRLKGGSGAPRAAVLAATVGILMTVPWIGLLHAETRSIDRFVDVAADFPRFARAYAYEEVGKYHRKAERLDEALEMYELCVQTYPTNSRFHTLIGSMYVRIHGKLDPNSPQAAEFLDKAIAAYEEGVRLEGEKPRVLTAQLLAKAYITKKDYVGAIDAHRRLLEIDPTTAENWANLGYCHLQLGQFGEALEAYDGALRYNRRLHVRHQQGAALLALGRFPEAVTAFRIGLQLGEDNPSMRYGLASAIGGTIEGQVESGEPTPVSLFDEAEGILRGLLQTHPQDSDMRALLGRITALRGSARIVPG